jgi:hypothetical protein
MWMVVCACIVLGALPQLLWSFLLMGAVGGVMGLLWFGVYLVMAVGAAYARLRPGRRV